MKIRSSVVFVLSAFAAACTAGPGSVATAEPSEIAPTTRPTLAVTAAPPTPPALPGPSQVIEVGEPVWGVGAVGGALWVEGEGRIHHHDGATGKKLGELPGSWPRVAGDSLWYLRDDELVEADGATGEERAVYKPPVLGTAVVDGVLWSASEDTGILTGVNLRTNKVTYRLELPRGEPKWIEPWEGLLWVLIDGSGGIIVRVDPATGTIKDQLDAGYRPHSAAVAFGSLWVTDHGRTRLLRYGPDGTTEAEIPGPGMSVAIAASRDAMWAASPTGVMRVDPKSNQVTGEVALGHGDWYGMALSGKSLWLTSAEAGRLYQIDPGP
jgi:hypothetical protein